LSSRERVGTQSGLKTVGNDGSEEAATAKNVPPEEHQQPSRRERSTILDEPRSVSKQARIIKMLSRKSGATLEALVDATGWLPHTTRAALAGLRRRGYGVTSAAARALKAMREQLSWLRAIHRSWIYGRDCCESSDRWPLDPMFAE
jgi:hypothetical protein